MEQMTLSMLPPLQDNESLADLERQANLMSEYGKQKRKWENAMIDVTDINVGKSEEQTERSE